jgi:putative ABC transport system permease protein
MNNNFKLALRQLAKYKGHTFLNLFGLAIGLAVCLLLFAWVKDEWSYDRFHAKADRVYRAYWKARFGENEWEITAGPAPLAPLLESQFGEVEKASQLSRGSLSLKWGSETRLEEKVLYIDEKFFDLFSVPSIEGDAQKAMSAPDGLVLTRSAAERYFGQTNVVGKSIQNKDGESLQVLAVVENLPAQSHLEFEFLRPIKTRKAMQERRDNWSSATCMTYFLLKPGMEAEVLQKKLQKYLDGNDMSNDFKEGKNYTSFPFQKLTDIHLHSDLDMEIKPNGSYAYLRIFGLTGCFILFLACINFINLATARLSTRAREVGVRKVLGSNKGKLIFQFLFEAFIQVVLAVVIAIALAQLSMPAFNTLADKQMSLDWMGTPFLPLLVLGLIAFTTLAAGAFPAYVLSGFQPIKVLKGQSSSGKMAGQKGLRSALVVTQFSISIALIIGAVAVRSQLQFLQNKRLGFDKERVLIVSRGQDLGESYQAFRYELEKSNAVELIGASTSVPSKEFDSTIFLPEQPANYEETSLTYAFVDVDFAKTLNVEFVQGRNFEAGRGTDSTACIINEAAVKRLGWEDPIGKTLTMGGFDPGKVVGVMKDFNYQSLHTAVEPLVLKLANWPPIGYLSIKLKPGQLEKGIADTKAAWQKAAPTATFNYSFLDEDFAQLYTLEQRMSRVFGIFSVLATLIACLGLFGMASFLAEQRTKEIGIRKVLGASVSSLTGMLAKDFLKWVLVAIVLASPLAWYFMNQWLADFAYRIQLQWWMFAAAGLGALLIAFLTVSFQSVRAALANPVKSLRSE